MDLSPYSSRESPDKIWFMRRARGDSPVERFIERLDDRTRRATWRVFDWVEACSPTHGTERLRRLEGDVLEIKVHHPVATRYMCFRVDTGLVLTRAIRKPENAMLQQLIRQTQWLHDEYERTRS